MAKKARRQRQDTFDFLCLWLTGYDVQAQLGVNPKLRMNPLLSDLDTRVLEASLGIEVRGKCFYPDERKGEKIVLTLKGESCPLSFVDAVADIQERDEHGVPKYRKYRGCPVPVFECPKGVARLRRGGRVGAWSAWINVPERHLSDCLAVLSVDVAQFISIHEHTVGKERWVNGFSIQTKNPFE